MACDGNQVQGVRGDFKACNVFMWYPLCCMQPKKNKRHFAFCDLEVSRVNIADIGLNFLSGLNYKQIGNNLTIQAVDLDTHVLPYGILNPLSLVIFIPIRDLLIYPALL